METIQSAWVRKKGRDREIQSQLTVQISPDDLKDYKHKWETIAK
jgi:hypothetical protein